MYQLVVKSKELEVSESMKSKYIRGFALGIAAMAAFTFTTPDAGLLKVEAATTTKAVKGTSKINASAKTVKVAKGKTATVKLTLNKTQTNNLKITVKSKNTKIAKVANASKVIVKKGKKVASVKIKGIKPDSSTKVVASFKTSSGKKKTVTITVKVNPIALTKVALNNKTPKIGDKLTAAITPSNASAVTYKWYMGESASEITTVISGQTKKTLTVTDEMEGMFIKVTATGKTAAGKTVNKSAATTSAVEVTEPVTPIDIHLALQ